MSTTTPLAASRISFLHGDLDIQIVQARHLPNMDLLSERFRRVASVFGCSSAFSKSRASLHENVQNHLNSRRQHHHENIITSDPYVTVCVAGAIVARTRVISNTTRPVWNEHFNVPLAHPVSCVDFLVKDNDVFGADWIGTASVPAQRIATGETIDDWFALLGANGKQPKVGCAIHIRMRFIHCDKTDRYQSSITGGGVDRSYFPVRHGGAVTLYQDAHVADEDLPPPVELEDGTEYKREKCWEDICHAILEAHHMVYIVGWSIYDKVKLVREPTKPIPDAGRLSLGDLLKHKSQEGVRVLLLVWDDKTSHSNFFINTKGVMQTHDEETKKFFKHSSVICVLSPRYASSKLSIFKQQVVGTLYTHHQKCVIVDSQASGNNRKLTAFLGGLDLCDGRYDTTEHRLLRDLNTTFKNDFHNPAFTAGTLGPRQPWHDLHCKIEGPAVYDVLTNFEQRWRKASKWSHLGKRVQRIAHWKDDALLKIGRISWFLSPSPSISGDDPKLFVREETDPENWNVQIFRSIDSGSVKGFPKDAQKAEDQNLVCAKHLTIDRSIQTAYVEAIRSAQHFIYIENQYFIGSSYAWHTYKNAGADNLIPMELAQKIASKIRAQERFVVYVVIPMWPEGNPSSASVQEILFWQRETMQMMYAIIAAEIKPENLHGVSLQDYLNFYCLGNREPPDEAGSTPTPSYHRACGGESVSPSQGYRRFMIYVHAKGMIVDDEYVILGSANINQRSMAGSRDTEIAMGAYQPHHTWAVRRAHPRGQVYGYRMSLWAEHLGEVDESHVEAESLDCVREVNRIAKENWARFTADSYTPLQGHLLRYPVEVESSGKISALPGQDQFPDVGGKILGAPTASLPDALTT